MGEEGWQHGEAPSIIPVGAGGEGVGEEDWQRIAEGKLSLSTTDGGKSIQDLSGAGPPPSSPSALVINGDGGWCKGNLGKFVKALALTPLFNPFCALPLII